MHLPRTIHAALRRAHAPRGRAAALAVITLLALAGTAAAKDDTGWPRQLDFTGGSIIVYQPQPEWLEADTLGGRAAFSYQKTGAASPVFGVFWFEALLAVDRDSGIVRARRLDLTRVRLPRGTAAETAQCQQVIEAGAAGWDALGTLAGLKAALAATDKERASIEDLEHDPPRILFAYERAILVPYDGEPMLEDVEGSTLRRVANTPFAVVFEPVTKTYYLNGANLWYSASDPLGPWTETGRVPESVRTIVPPDTSAEAQVTGEAPEVLTATEPTELISTDGPPLWAPLAGAELLYVTNTESDVLREVETQALYVLLAGRWYTSDSPEGPWSFVPGDALPASFREIPAGSAKGYLRASVAGTEEAADAVADAGIPQTAAIRQGVSDLIVAYDGEPEWEYVEDAAIYYCLNSDVEVIYADERYYACDQGVWYIADDPYGPWRVSQTRPIGLDDLPPGCPVYHLRYVHVFDWTPDYVYVGYLPGYVGSYPCYGTVVYGTGYRYKSWRRRLYQPRPVTWGFAPRYNPWLGRWSFGYSYDTGFLRVGTRWRAIASTARHHGPAPWFGPGGYRRPLLAPTARSCVRGPPAGRAPRRVTASPPTSTTARGTPDGWTRPRYVRPSAGHARQHEDHAAAERRVRGQGRQGLPARLERHLEGERRRRVADGRGCPRTTQERRWSRGPRRRSRDDRAGAADGSCARGGGAARRRARRPRPPGRRRRAARRATSSASTGARERDRPSPRRRARPQHRGQAGRARAGGAPAAPGRAREGRRAEARAPARPGRRSHAAGAWGARRGGGVHEANPRCDPAGGTGAHDGLVRDREGRRDGRHQAAETAWTAAKDDVMKILPADAAGSSSTPSPRPGPVSSRATPRRRSRRSRTSPPGSRSSRPGLADKEIELKGVWETLSANLPSVVETVQKRVDALPKARLPAGLDQAAFEQIKTDVAAATSDAGSRRRPRSRPATSARPSPGPSTSRVWCVKALTALSMPVPDALQ